MADTALVAVIDDQALNRRLIRMHIERGFEGVSVIEGVDGRDAVALRTAHPEPDLMIVNGLMPAMDGVEAITAIRSLEAELGLPRVPIAISSTSRWWLDAGMAAGADGELKLLPNYAELVALVSSTVGVAPLPRLRLHPSPAESLPKAPIRLPLPVPTFPAEIRVDAGAAGGRREGVSEDGRRWVAVPTYGASSRSVQATFGFECPRYEARHDEVWDEAQPCGRRTCGHRTRIVEPT